MIKHLTKLQWIAWIICLLTGIVLSIKNLKEPDLWWQLRTGEWIIEKGKVPTEDVFSYTYAGTKWINVKWGYEVLIAGITRIAGVESIFLLQIISTLIILFFLYKTANSFRSQVLNRNNSPPSLGIIISALVALFIISFRMNGRPEMVSHCLSVVFLFVLISYRNKPGNWVFLLIPLQILWTNMHEAYGMGIVMLLIFSLSSWLEYWVFKSTQLKIKDLAKLTAVTVLAIVSMAVHPYGVEMILHPFDILSQLNENKFTTELYSFTNEQYWQLRSILSILIFFLCFLFLAYQIKRLQVKAFIMQFGLAYLVLFGAFFYLSLTAYRNIPFFIFISFPLLALIIDSFKINKKTLPYLYLSAIIVGVIFYISVGSGFFYENFEKRDRYGLEINVSKNPVGAASFIEENQITGKGFVDYLSSSYLLWRLKPEFKTYIDLRDLDIFPSKFIENVITCYLHPDAQLSSGHTLWQYVDQADTFDYVVLLNSKNFERLHQYLIYRAPEFELVYADPLASVYLRRTKQHQELIRKYGFSRGNNVFRKFKPVKPASFAYFISKLFWPTYQPEDYKDFNYYGAARIYYNQIGKKDFEVKREWFE